MISALNNNPSIKEAFVVARHTFSDSEKTYFERSDSPLRLVRWQDILENLRVTPQDDQGLTIRLSNTIHECRRLLSLIAQEPRVLGAIEHRRFEEMVATLLSDLGWDEVELMPGSHDGGKDIIASRRDVRTGNRLVVFFECKHWCSGKRVHVQVVTKLARVVADSRVSAGVLIATGGFAPTLVEQQMNFERSKIFLRGSGDIHRWISVWERSYLDYMLAPVDPLQVLELHSLGTND